ncbi:MAG: hypothetical protein ACFE8T_15575, partial [Promethearchaeota archaeon]
IISEQFVDLTDYFKEKFVTTIQNTLDQVTNQLATISDAAGEMSTDLGDTFTDIESGLSETLEDLDQRISTVYEDVDKGIEELKQTFQSQIYQTLEEDIMMSIIKQLDLSENTMTEFWERSKKASMLTFKDVWFVRSVEGIKAQINESITRLKMRIHIIAPRLADVDLVALSKVKKHTNIRISTNFNLSDPDDKAKLAEIIKYPNIGIRHYPREDLWGINRDYEEVVVCAVSKMGEGELEIAGMGSILEEHVKLFAGVLEEVWMQAKKIGDEEIRYSLGADFQAPPQKKYEPVMPQTNIDIPKEINIPKSTSSFKPEPVIKKQPVEKKVKPLETLQQKPKVKQKPLVEPQSKTHPSIEIPKPVTVDLGGKSVSEIFTKILNNLDSKLGSELSSDIEILRNKIVEERGYSRVLSQMSITIAALKTIPELLSRAEREDTHKKIKFWKKQLNL